MKLKSLFLPLVICLSFVLETSAANLAAPSAPSVAAKSYLLGDFTTGQVLVSQNAHARVEPASLTKLMTAYLTFSALKQGRLKLIQALPISNAAYQAEGSRMFVEKIKPVTVDELLRGMIVQSGNDASIALAEGVAGSEAAFTEMMNKEAQRLGLQNTHFTNATGLPHPQHYTTAADLFRIAHAIIRDFPEYYPLYSLKEYTYNTITQPNRNRLLWLDPYVDGMKTGHTEAAGYCLITSAKRGPMRLVLVVLGTASDGARVRESQKLLNYGFQFFETHKVYQKGAVIANLPVWKGSEKVVNVGLPQDLYLTLLKGEYPGLKASLLSKQPLFAPLKAGQPIATLRLTKNGAPLADYPLVALTEVPVAGFFGRTWDSIKLFFK